MPKPPTLPDLRRDFIGLAGAQRATGISLTTLSSAVAKHLSTCYPNF